MSLNSLWPTATLLDVDGALFRHRLRVAAAIARATQQRDASQIKRGLAAIQRADDFLTGSERVPEAPFVSLDQPGSLEGAFTTFPSPCYVETARFGNHVVVVRPNGASSFASHVLLLPADPHLFCPTVDLATREEYQRDPFGFAIARRHLWDSSFEREQLRNLHVVMERITSAISLQTHTDRTLDSPLTRTVAFGALTAAAAAVGVPPVLTPFVAEYLRDKIFSVLHIRKDS